MTGKTTLTELKAREREARVNLILDAAERVFATKPFDSVSMREIADEAGMATSSIYTYFPHQETLFVEACVRDHKNLMSEIMESLKDGESMNLSEIINTYIDFYARNIAFFRMMTLFMSKGDLSAESMEKLNDIIRQILDQFDKVFSETIYGIKTRYLSHFLFAALNGIVVTFRKFPGRSDDDIISHMKKLGTILEEMIVSMNEKNSLSDN